MGSAMTSELPNADAMRAELVPKLGAVVFAGIGLETRSVQLIWAINNVFPGNFLVSMLTAGVSLSRLWDIAESLLVSGPDSDLLPQFRVWRKQADKVRIARNAAVHSQWAPMATLDGRRVWVTLDISGHKTGGVGIIPNPIGFDQLDELTGELTRVDRDLAEIERTLTRRHQERPPQSH
jgi:hypothetical protein